MFVLSILDKGDERNFLTSDVKLEGRYLVATVGMTSQRFAIADVIDIVLVDCSIEPAAPVKHCRSSSVN